MTAQLIHAADGSHLWSERYDRDLTDVFAVQDEIAAAIAGALQVKLTGKPATTPHRTESARLRSVSEGQASVSIKVGPLERQARAPKTTSSRRLHWIRSGPTLMLPWAVSIFSSEPLVCAR